MGVVEIICTTIAGLITLVAVALAARAVTRMLGVVRQGQPDPARLGSWGARTKVMLKETAGHTRMLKWSAVGAAHWFVMVAFVVLSLLVLEAYFEVVTPTGGIPWLSSWVVFGFVTEIIGILGVIGILYLISVRLRCSLRSHASSAVVPFASAPGGAAGHGPARSDRTPTPVPLPHG